MIELIFETGPSGMAETRIKEKMEGFARPMGIKFDRVIATMSRTMRPNENQGNT